MSDQPIREGDHRSEPEPDGELIKSIINAIRQINYGSIEIVIHDSRIVQIERREKIRFDCDPSRKRS